MQDKFITNRRRRIRAILKRGKAVRFSMDDNRWKDINKFEPDEMNDLLSFRDSGNVYSKYICWTNQGYEISAVDI